MISGCVPASLLAPLRRHCEQMLERHKQWWIERRKPGEPSGGEWETSIRPAMMFGHVVDPENVDSVEFVFHENTYGVSRTLMQAQKVAPLQFSMFCNPRKDCGPADWHRDIRSWRDGPIEGIFIDQLYNPPGYVQLHIALYDDDVLWIVPGSHKRFNTEDENRQLSQSEHQPLDTGRPVKLRAGDGLVLINTILHWGSNYSTRLRRTLQLTYRSFDGQIFPHARGYVWQPNIVDRLPPHLADRFRHFLEWQQQEDNLLERTFNTVLDKDEGAFRDCLARLHPGPQGRMTAVILLSKIAGNIHRGPREPLRSRFTDQQRHQLWQRFTDLDAALQADSPQLVPGFQNKDPTPYLFNEMPDYSIEDFISSWRPDSRRA